jgi:hypothetical protein
LQAYVRRFLRIRAQGSTVPNEIVIEAMIKGLRPGAMTQYFARNPPQTLEKLLQKMDKYIRADNDFQRRREEAYRYSERTRGFGGRLHPRHVRTIHNPSSNDDKRQSYSRASAQVPVIRNTTKLLQATSSKKQRRKKLRWKVQLPTKKVVLLILWRRQRTYNKDVPSHDPETKGNG